MSFSGDEISCLEKLLVGDDVVFKEAWMPTLATNILISDDGAFTLMADGVDIIKVNDVNEAAIGFVMLHSVFHLRCPRSMATFGLLIQKVFGIDDGTRIPSKALSLLRRLD